LKDLKEDPSSTAFPVLRVKQPIGEFFLASIPAKVLVEITWFDVRRVLMEKRDIERYLGIQRPLNDNRVKELERYVNTTDACFPTAVIIAVPGDCVQIDESNSRMTLTNITEPSEGEEPVLFRRIAKVIDGQHRLAGLHAYKGENFDVNVAIFVDADIADQATIFSTVNLAQTKVNKSLVYDLFDLANARSPQRVSHNIAVTLDRENDSPLHKKIKRLGVATPGRTGETITQATFVQGILHYLSADPMIDRDLYLKGKKPSKVAEQQLTKHIFQHLFVDEKDFEITDCIWNYFAAVKKRWPNAWDTQERGAVLNRTNGFRALAKFLRNSYLRIGKSVPSMEDYLTILARVELKDSDFNVENFPPGTSGESALYKALVAAIPAR
jgi:DGQHR domain-containing protein